MRRRIKQINGDFVSRVRQGRASDAARNTTRRCKDSDGGDDSDCQLFIKSLLFAHRRHGAMDRAPIGDNAVRGGR